MRNLNEDIRTHSFRPVYLLYGDEAYLRTTYKNKLKHAILPEGDTINLTVFEGKDIDPEQIIAQAETMPFFAEHRLILVEESGFFKLAKPEAEPAGQAPRAPRGTTGQSRLADYIPQMPEETILLFVESEVDKRGKLYKAVNNRGRAVEMKRQDQDSLDRWVMGKLGREGKRMQRSTLDLFFSLVGNDMENIENELEKLLCYTAGSNVILREDVETICTVTTENKVFDMINAAVRGQQKKALDMFCELLANKESPIRILILMARQFNRLWQIREMREHGFGIDDIAQKMELRPFVVRKEMNQAARFEEKTLRRAVRDCVEADTAVKTGRMDARLAVEMILIKYSAAGQEPGRANGG